MERIADTLQSNKIINREYQALIHSCQQNLNKPATDQIGQIINKLIAQVAEKESPEFEKYGLQALNVAKTTVEEVGLGRNSVLAAVSYEMYINALIELQVVEAMMPTGVLNLVNGLIKISDFGTNKTVSQAENFRKLLLSLVTDVRVILIKLSEILYFMRNIKLLPRERQLRLAHEANFLYIPLAHRLGLYKVKSEMEDIALKITSFDVYKDIARKLQQTAKSRNTFIDKFISPIKERLEKEGFTFEIKGRPKTIFSIHQKMKKNNITFNEVYDKFAIRIIIDNAEDNEKAACWNVYSIVTNIYQPNPLRLRDWISVPKSNGYESLHTTVVVPGGQWVEVQIRTRRMDDIAEKGFAAHWKYKGGKAESGLDEWLGKVRELLEEPEPDAEKFIDDFKLSLYNKEIFVFTPKGDLKKFPKGATILDFAFDIHTDIGTSCAGAMVNGKNVPIRHVMQNGEKIEIFTSKNQKPKRDWLNLVVTSKAKSKIKQTLNETKLRDAEIGKDLVKRRFRNWKIEYNDVNINHLLRHFKLKNAQDFYALIANEKLDISEVKDILISNGDKTEDKSTLLPSKENKNLNRPGKSEDYLIIDENLVNVDYQLAKCCNPIYGDEIFAFVTVGDGIKIHRINCPNASRLLSKYNYRVLNAKWKESDIVQLFTAEIYISGIEEFGLLHQISELIANEMKMTLRSINLDNTDGMFSGTIKVMVKDKKQLEGMIRRLNQMPTIMKALRVDN